MVTITNPKTHRGLIALFLMALLFSFEAAAQNEVAIGSATTKSNAILWLNGNGSQGLILPVVTNKSAVSNPDKGMVVYDDSDNKVWYRSNSAWVEVGSGTGATTTNLNLLLQGNQLQLRDGTTVQSTVNIAAGTQTNGAFLVFTGGSWQYATLSGDVTGANGALVVNGIKGKTIATLPATTQALVYDPSANAGAGGWSFQALTGTAVPTLNNGQLLTGNGTTNTATTITGDATLSGGAITISNNAITTAKISANAVDATKLADNAVTTAKISDATITGADIAGSTITADKLAQSAATTGQILKWNGTNWVPQNETTGTTTTLSNGQILTGNGTTNAATTLSGDATLSGGALTISNNAITTAKINANAVDATKLADNAVTSAKISDATITNADIANGTITATKLAQSGANTSQVLQWNGTNWVPVTLSSGGTVTQINTANGLTGGPITNSGTISIASSGVGSTELADNAVVTNKISDNAVTTGKINNSAVDNTKLADNAVTSVKISDGSITGADIAAATITADKLAQSSATSGQVLKWNGTNWVPQNDDAGVGATPTLSNGQLLVGNGTTNSAVALSGDATLAGGVITIGNNAITTAKITAAAVDATKLADGSVTNLKVANDAITSAKISNATITGADIANTTITGGNIAPITITADKLAQSAAATGQVLKWNGTNWVPAADDAGATPTLTNGQILVGNGTTNSAVALSGDATLAGGVITIGNNAITTAKINANAVDATKLADNSVTAAKISDGSITGADLATNIAISTTGNVSVNAPGIISGIGSGLTTLNASNISSGSLALARITPGANGQVLTTVAGVPAWQTSGAGATTLDGLTDATVTAASSGQLLVNDGAGQFRNVSMSGDASITNAGLLTLTNSAGTRTNLGLGALATLATVTTTEITDGTIANIDINAAAAIAGTKITPAFGAQPISTTGTLFSGAATVTGLTVSGTTTTFNTVGYTWPAVQGGAGTILTNSGTGALTWTAAGMTNPLTTNGDIIYGVGSTPTRLAAGTGFLKGGAVPSYAAVNLVSADVSGILPITNGGTGAITAPTALSNLGGLSNTLTNGNIFVGSAGNIATPVAMGGDATISNTGVLTIAAGAVNLTTDVTGTLPSSRGGTGLTSVVLGGVAYGGATDFGFTAAGTSGQLLQSNGTAAPTWVNAPTSGWSLTGNAGTNPATNFIGTTDAQPLRLNTGVGGIERMRIDATGNVGIGSIAPTHKLEIAGGGNVLGFDNNAQLRSKNGSGVYETWLFPRDGNTMYLNYGSDGFHIRDNSSITRMFMDNTGKVGVGTIAPSTDMQIDASTPTLRLRSTQSNTLSQSYIEFGHDDGSGGYVSAGSIGDTGAGDFMQIFSPNAIIFNSNFAFRFSIGTNGELGVGGTLDPGTAGQVLTSGGSGASPSWTAASSGWGLSGNAGTDATNFIGTTDAQPLRFATGVGGTERMRIDAAGDVGIGTNNPRSKLEIQSGDLVLSGNATTPLDPPDINFVTQTNVNKAKIWTSQTTNTLWISTSLTPTGVGQRHLTLDPNGNFGFSNESPTEKVDIGGNVKFSGALMPNNSAGASGQVLASAGAGLPPIWTNPSGTTLINNTGIRNLFAGSPIGTTTTGTDNAFYGSGAGDVNTTGNWNVFVGTSAATNHSTGDLNTIIGWNAGQLGTGHQGNTLIGAQAGQNTTGITNTFIGEKSGQANTSGIESVFVGNSAGLANTTGSRNTILGYFANVGAAGLQNASAIGHRASVNQSNSLVLGSINGVNGATANTSVGIGTTTPSARLDISGNTLIRGTNTNAAPTVSSGLELMVGRSNFGTLIAGQTSADIALNWGGASGGFRHFIQTRHNSVANSNSNSIDFFVNNSTTAAGSIAPNNTTPNGNVLAMSMTAAGIGIGTATPNANTKVHISGAGTQYLRVEGTGAGATGGIEFDGTGTAADWRIVPQLGILTFNLGDVNGTINRMYQMNAGYFIPDNTGNPNPTLGQSTARWGTIFTTIAVNVSSDRRLKNNIHNLNYGLKEILELRPVSYSLRSDKTRNTYLGLIAQEVQELIPEIVSTGDDAEKTLGMRYAELVPVLIKAIQEQQAIIETLKSENAASNEKTEKLNKEIEAIKARLGMTAKVEK